MAIRYRFGTRKRDELWERECTAACRAGRGALPICNLCDTPVVPPADWDESHEGAPRALGGKSVGVAHRACNRRDNNLVVTPMVAKAERVRKTYLGITGPGLGKSAMPCGRRSARRKTMHHGVQPRLTPAQRHQQFLDRRYGFLDHDFGAAVDAVAIAMEERP